MREKTMVSTTQSVSKTQAQLFETIMEKANCTSYSGVVRYALGEVCSDLNSGRIIRWSSILKTELPEGRALNDYSEKKSISFDADQYEMVKKNVCRELGMSKPRISYVINLALLYAYGKIRRAAAAKVISPAVQENTEAFDAGKFVVTSAEYARRLSELKEKKVSGAEELIDGFFELFGCVDVLENELYKEK